VATKQDDIRTLQIEPGRVGNWRKKNAASGIVSFGLDQQSPEQRWCKLRRTQFAKYQSATGTLTCFVWIAHKAISFIPDRRRPPPRTKAENSRFPKRFWLISERASRFLTAMWPVISAKSNLIHPANHVNENVWN